MKYFSVWILISAFALSGVGCAAKVEPTDDSVKIKVDVPKVEVKKTPDLNPATDDDVDIDTPAPGDK